MHLSNNQINRLIDSLSQLNYDFEQVLEDGLENPNANSLFTRYKELRTFLKNLEVSNQELKERISRLPSLQAPNYLIKKVIYLNAGLLGLVSPYLLMIILTFTAPVSIPLIILTKIWTDKQKRKVREIASLVSSIKFIIEHPSYFTAENK